MSISPKLRQCDCCGALVHRLHPITAYGTDTDACDLCYDYDCDAYGEPTEDDLAETFAAEERAKALADGIESGDLDPDGNPIPYPPYRGA